MNYKFVYDKAFLQMQSLDLSEEEIRIVLATIVGQHNAIFYGYKPERLVNAIRILNGGKPFIEAISLIGCSTLSDRCINAVGGIAYIKQMNLFNKICKDLLTSNTSIGRGAQYIATVTSDPCVCVSDTLRNNFDVVYYCKKTNRSYRTTTEIKKVLKKAITYQHSLDSGTYPAGLYRKDMIKQWWVGETLYNLFWSLDTEDKVMPFKYLKVARSLADVDNYSNPRNSHWEEAKRLYNNQYNNQEEVSNG